MITSRLEKMKDIHTILKDASNEIMANRFDRLINPRSHNGGELLIGVKNQCGHKTLRDALGVSQKVLDKESSIFLRFLRKKFNNKESLYLNLTKEEKAHIIEEFDEKRTVSMIYKIIRSGNLNEPRCISLIGHSTDLIIIRHQNPQRFDHEIYSLIVDTLETIDVKMENFISNRKVRHSTLREIYFQLLHSLTMICLSHNIKTNNHRALP